MLWLCGDVPEPPRSGLHAYSRGLVRAIAACGAEVRCLGLAAGGAAPRGMPNEITWQIVPGRRRRQPTSLVSALPAMAHGFALRTYREAVARACREHWDAIVIDHLQMGWALPLLRQDGGTGRVVHVSHNCETVVRGDVASETSGLASRIARRWDAWKVARLERVVVRAADLVTAITDDDARALEALGARRVLTLNPGYEGPLVERAITPEIPRRAVLVGNFQWRVKDANLARFLAVADPQFARGGAELRVVGPVGRRVRAMAARLRATTLTGWTESLVDELAGARLGIVAEPVGGGFKMKTLDMIFAGVPIAALAGSINGLPLVAGESLFVFADEASLASGALGLLDDVERLDRAQRAAQAACRRSFNWVERGERLLDAILEL